MKSLDLKEVDIIRGYAPQDIFITFITTKMYNYFFTSSKWKAKGVRDNEGLETKQGHNNYHSDKVMDHSDLHDFISLNTIPWGEATLGIVPNEVRYQPLVANKWGW